ncbi:hypothetical protein O7614_26645 [Micromonospora sp. WMMD961]|uniref:hypothetical protein n=1 Tax=Micromonospora sp. WMMD961 TaxID=3016100 RepID=UPI0024163CF3|nr:hypothetical protein [Micromonospora sp. WMMD961]MDG4783244.1 hypothetical protein [Micromonospora sp. WMMD961]
MALIGPWINQTSLDTATNEWVIEGIEPDPDVPWEPMGRIVIRIPVNSVARASLYDPPPMDPPAAEPEPEDPFPLPDIETTD